MPELSEARPDGGSNGTALKIDCDVHPGVPTVEALMPYMDDYWVDEFRNRQIDGLEIATYPPNAPLSCRPDWRRDGERPGADRDQLSDVVLDTFGSDIAICNPVYGGLVALSEQMAAVLCRATNCWIAEQWLDRDPRLRSSIVVPAQNPILAAEEIERCAADARFVQIMLLVANELLLGRQYYWPIYEAAQKHGLPICIHAGSMYRYPTTPSGWPSHYLQDYAATPQLFTAQMQNLMSEGALARFPGITFVLAESGISWLPPYMWRASRTWKGVRGEVPWIKRAPSAEVRDRFRVTLQPFDVTDDHDRIEKLVEQIGGEHMLLFSSDFPHWQFDGDDPVPSAMPEHLVRKMRTDNPLSIYTRLREDK
ncbi:amidohydrolase family protein [bacterium]|nr:amidohydrolase family protein [bacterium]